MCNMRPAPVLRNFIEEYPVETADFDARVTRLKSAAECRVFAQNALERHRFDLAVQALHRLPALGGRFGRSQADRNLIKRLRSSAEVMARPECAEDARRTPRRGALIRREPFQP